MSNENKVVLPEPVTWLIERSAFRVSPHGQDAESNEWLEEAHEPGEEGSFPVYTEQQVRALLATVTGKSGSNDSPLLAGVSAPAAPAITLLAGDHSGMKVDYRGLFKQVQRAIKRSDPGYAEMLRQLEDHLQELGQRWYAGDTNVVDEILQLYCIERDARKTVGAAATAAPQAQAVERDALTPAARDVLAERARQVSAEGWTPERDDQYTDCQLAAAAASYAVCGKDPKALKLMGVTAWPWRDYWWKPETYRRNLEKAGALILAEIERIDRQPSRA